MKLASENRVWVSKVDDKGTYGQLTVSTSRKDKKTDKNVYSNWYVRLVGSDAYDPETFSALMAKYLDGEKNAGGFLKNKFPINITAGEVTNESYEKADGTKVWQNPQVVCFAWEFVTGEVAHRKPTQEIKVDEGSPFDE